MHELLQLFIDVLIVVMGAILVLFTIGLIILHIIATSRSKRIARIKKRILRMLNPGEDLEYYRGQIYKLLDPDSDIRTLKDIRGIRSSHGTIAMTLVIQEIEDDERERLRNIILNDKWYLDHIRTNLDSLSYDRVGVFTKLIAEVRIPGFEKQIKSNLYRLKKHADNQEIGLLALFMNGCHDDLVSVFGDPGFDLILSFRSIQELFACYAGNHTALYRELLWLKCDLYITRACIRGAEIDGAKELCPLIEPYLHSDNANLVIDSTRALGTLGYKDAIEEIKKLAYHESWSVRSVAVSAIAQLDPENSYDILLHALCDREWWVRFHAAEALSMLKGHPALMEDVKKLDDNFAFDMMRYITERNELMNGEVTVQ